MEGSGWAYITSGDVRQNMRIHGILESALKEVYLDPTPEWISAECGVVVKLRAADAEPAKALLSQKGISGFRVLF